MILELNKDLWDLLESAINLLRAYYKTSLRASQTV